MAARPWRPRLDDVDRLARGEGAKVRGTGCRDIPHRLNSMEREVYAAAKKKGFLAVRGTGYRKERRGHPLPNVFRQWCDARELPCVVIEQDMVGGAGIDRVVVDLSTLRTLDSSAARDMIDALAADAGVRKVASEERPLEDVPFNVLPILMPGTPEAAAPRWTQPNTSLGTPANVKKRSHAAPEAASTSQTTDGSDKGDASDEEEPSPGNGGAAAIAAANAAAGAAGMDALKARAELTTAAVAEQRQLLISLKSGPPPRPNTDPDVAAAVKKYKRLQAEDGAAMQAMLDAQASAAVAERRASSARSASIWEAFEEFPALPEGEGEAEGLLTDGADTAGSASEGVQDGVDGDGVSSSNAEDHGARGSEGKLDNHPYFKAAIWQIPAEPLFFEADRTTAKDLARAIVDSVRAAALI